MSLPFLKVSPEEAVVQIQGMSLAGYQLKDAINAEHEKARIAGGTALIDAAPTWVERCNNWINECLGKLEAIYESQVYAYEFRDADALNTVTMSGNPTRSHVVFGIQYRINKLSEYERFIRGHVPIEINAGRDIFFINAEGANVRTKNK